MHKTNDAAVKQDMEMEVELFQQLTSAAQHRVLNGAEGSVTSRMLKEYGKGNIATNSELVYRRLLPYGKRSLWMYAAGLVLQYLAFRNSKTSMLWQPLISIGILYIAKVSQQPFEPERANRPGRLSLLNIAALPATVCFRFFFRAAGGLNPLPAEDRSEIAKCFGC
ncbi:MAG: hypothetical protein P1U63_08040 [Coxiellaceae bacterium]|nr:hypothetical protein [Coxiellaceae bacterium]